MSERLSITSLGPYIGAQITGADLTRPLSDNQFEQLYHAVLRHHVVFLRDRLLRRSSNARWPSVLASCIFTLFTLMLKGLTRSSSWIPITIIRRITTTGTPM